MSHGLPIEVESIAEHLFFTTVRILAETPDGVSIGTGFIFSHTKNDSSYAFIVTNKHVVKDSKKGRIIFHKADDKKPSGDAIEVNVEEFDKFWVGHPSEDIDVTIGPFGDLYEEMKKRNQEIFFRAVPSDLIPTGEKLKEIDAFEQVIFIGYPTGLSDTFNNTPISRTGITATPVILDYEGKKSFLIDASVFPGSSGSPVFIYNPGSHPDKKGGLVAGTRILFVGILTRMLYQEEEGRVEFKEIPSNSVPYIKSKRSIDLGLVFKSDTILETIDEYLKTRP